MRIFPARDHLFLRDATGDPLKYGSLPNRTIDGEVLGTLADWLALKLGAAPAAPSAGR